jgi:hypothetical protein
LPDGEGVKWVDWAFSCYRTYKIKGGAVAMVEFLAMTKGWMAKADGTGSDIPPPASPDQIQMDRDHEFWFKHEYILSVYAPNLSDLRRHLEGSYKGKLKCAVTVGDASQDAPYARTVPVQKDLIGCDLHHWPGGHLLHQVDPAGFVDALLGTLKKLDE